MTQYNCPISCQNWFITLKTQSPIKQLFCVIKELFHRYLLYFFFFCWTNFWRSTLSKWKLGSSWLNPKVSSLWTLSIVLLAETVCCGFNWDWSGNLKETNRRRCVPVKRHRWPCGFLFFFSLSFLQRADSQYEKLPVFLIPLRHSETYGPAVTSVFICQPTAPAAESR